jgi:hypothetical protein
MLLQLKRLLIWLLINHINKPKPESLAVLKILDSTKAGEWNERRPRMMKKSRLIEELEEIEILPSSKTQKAIYY